MTRAVPTDAAPMPMPQVPVSTSYGTPFMYTQPAQQRSTQFSSLRDYPPTTMYQEHAAPQQLAPTPEGLMSAQDTIGRRFSFQTGGEELPQPVPPAQEYTGPQPESQVEMDDFYANYTGPAYDEPSFGDSYNYGPDASGAYGNYSYEEDDDDNVAPMTERVNRLQIVNPSMSDDEEPSSYQPGHTEYPRPQ
ncbi:hypothetical protein KEM54_002080 [Ascosphaera aggregata]|nr:hypothetical protein KEM54_002080 [Ascosphaera aggregata]